MSAATKPTVTQTRTLRALAYEGFGGEDGWKTEYAVGRSAEHVGTPCGSWYGRLSVAVACGWAERNEDHGYVRWRITDAGRRALAAVSGGDETGGAS